MRKKIVQVGEIECGSGNLVLIAGPCVIENKKSTLETAERLKDISLRLKMPLIFKSSFQKDNRSSLELYRGPGLEEGLRILEEVKNQAEIPVLSDIHHPDQAQMAASVLDVIQIPAYLCMQTDLVVAAAQTLKPINLKRGQFMAPENMINPVKKVESSGLDKIFLTERGYTFGYNDLIVDPRSFYILRQLGYPVFFDVTHSIRRSGFSSTDERGSTPEFLPVLARAAVASGIDGLFIETHPDPRRALCDAASQLNLDDLEEFLHPLLDIHAVTARIAHNRRD